MIFFELEPSDISNLNDADLRELVARLCEAELIRQEIQTSCVLWGGAQEAADGGLDVRVVDAIPLLKPGFVSRENTGFQVKKNDLNDTDPLADIDNRIVEVRLTLEADAAGVLRHQIFRQVKIRFVP